MKYGWGNDFMRSGIFKGLKVGNLCDRGIKRPYNEDSTFVLRYDLGFQGSAGKISRSGWILAVADGVGGHEKGDVASKLALTTFSGQVMYSSVNTSLKTQNDFAEILNLAYREANATVYEELGKGSSDPNHPPGTTLVVANIIGSNLYVGNVGDSRCYLFSGGKITRATKDDSYVQELIDSGEITEVEARTHPRRNEITNVVGCYKPDVFTAKIDYIGSVTNYDHILLCSDGLHGVVTDKELVSIIYNNKTIKKSCIQLVELAKKRGGPDNISVVLAQIVIDERK